LMGRSVMRKSILFLQIAMVCGLSLAFAESKQWVHVNVEDSRKPAKVKVNLPVSLVETMMPLIEEKSFENGKVRLNDKEFRVEDLRKMWNEVRKQGDSEFVSIQSPDTNIRVFTEGKYLFVEPQKGSNTHVNIQIPLAVVDAMLSGSGQELNLTAAVQALRQSGVSDIISIQNEDAHIRVWIDENKQAR